MGLFTSYQGLEDRMEGGPVWPIDLGAFRIGPHPLGGPPDPRDPWGRLLAGDAVFKPQDSGLEIGTRAGAIDYAFVEIGTFTGGFRRNGQPLDLGPDCCVDWVRKHFGEPYWTDESDGERILFYEYDGGCTELQFEFPDGQSLGFLTLSRDGVLSDATRRAAYGCDRPWPPA